jgi:hypothetical protein
MSFGELFNLRTNNQEKEVKEEFFLDMALLLICLFILQMIREADPKGCNIPIREWLMVFCALYFSRSAFKLVKIYVVRYYR